MPEIEIRRTIDTCKLVFGVKDVPDLPRRDDTRKPIVPYEVVLEYRRVDGGRWITDEVKVYGKSRLRGGGVGDVSVTEVLHQRAGIGDIPPQRWPNWLRELADTYRPRT